MRLAEAVELAVAHAGALSADELEGSDYVVARQAARRLVEGVRLHPHERSVLAAVAASGVRHFDEEAEGDTAYEALVVLADPLVWDGPGFAVSAESLDYALWREELMG